MVASDFQYVDAQEICKMSNNKPFWSCKYDFSNISHLIILMIYCFLQINQRDLNVAIIGQSTFAAEVYKLLLKNGHRVVGVFTILDKGNRQDPLGRYQLILCSYAIYIIDL